MARIGMRRSEANTNSRCGMADELKNTRSMRRVIMKGGGRSAYRPLYIITSKLNETDLIPSIISGAQPHISPQ